MSVETETRASLESGDMQTLAAVSKRDAPASSAAQESNHAPQPADQSASKLARSRHLIRGVAQLLANGRDHRLAGVIHALTQELGRSWMTSFRERWYKYHMPRPDPNPKFDLNINVSTTTIEQKIDALILGIKKMSAELDTLSAQVATNTTVVESAIALINGIAQRIIDAGTDPTALSALATSLQTEDDALAAAVAANVVAAPVTP